MARIEKTPSRWKVVHETNGMTLGYADSRSEAQDLAREIRRRNR